MCLTYTDEYKKALPHQLTYLECTSAGEQEMLVSWAQPKTDTSLRSPAYPLPAKCKQEDAVKTNEIQERFQVSYPLTYYNSILVSQSPFNHSLPLACLKKLLTVSVTGLKAASDALNESSASDVTQPVCPGAKSKPVPRLSSARRSTTALAAARASSIRAAVSRRCSWVACELVTMSCMWMAVQANGMRYLPSLSHACCAACLTLSRFCQQARRPSLQKASQSVCVGIRTGPHLCVHTWDDGFCDP